MLNKTLTPQTTPSRTGPKVGLVLGSGAARGWAHIGVLRAFDDMGLKPDVIAGCSVGALVGGAHLLGVLPEFEKWARELGPLAAMRDFAVNLSHGGFLNPDAAFKAFRHADKPFADLPIPFGVNATDLGTGRELWITEGSVIDAVRASSAIPMVIHAAKMPQDHGDHWLVDGALSNPVPVDLARSLGADKVIAVDLTAVALTLERFDPPPTRAVTLVEPAPLIEQQHLLPEPLHNLVANTRHYVERQLQMAKAKMQATPHFFETAIATIDIFQTQLAEAKSQIHKPDVRLMPDMRAAGPTSFDRADEFIEIGYRVTMDAREEISALFAGKDIDGAELVR
ncbi:patatin-like phospholipase family protein [Aquisalinus flavus]|uniref:Patatin family protein n=1 Tax=Aquisalinus flavus TaxID=1526572 RepID=A0A8J2Y384_9PROT|nr:patatin-like phospholipase family protein [Aquisalinus flavus]MBD0427356.1 patatin-like phospholipase family protein [Aquisalinus flavus]UNE47161.1 hypothetical protein FF099_03355 [Aquisalinus flavus]GGD00377.1 patatin family protein [Aquisalinus flavus]